MTEYNTFSQISPCDLADGLQKNNFVSYQIKPLWQPIPRIAGPAFTVQVSPGDHLMLHAAIYEAPAGSIIVVAGGSDDCALAGGNVCAIAQKRGIAGFVVDGLVRDLAQIRQLEFPVFARGVIPIPAKKLQVSPMNQPVICGGARVCAGDVIVADEEGIAVIAKDQADTILAAGQARQHKDQSVSLEQWQQQHHGVVQKHLIK